MCLTRAAVTKSPYSSMPYHNERKVTCKLSLRRNFRDQEDKHVISYSKNIHTHFCLKKKETRLKINSPTFSGHLMSPSLTIKSLANLKSDGILQFQVKSVGNGCKGSLVNN